MVILRTIHNRVDQFTYNSDKGNAALKSDFNLSKLKVTILVWECINAESVEYWPTGIVDWDFHKLLLSGVFDKNFYSEPIWLLSNTLFLFIRK